ncbi:hypothetical protein PINS_up008923 [Pythium insidiosum]|nr:hypothetical protein PINS_up008923 [Pythium insidiosum]
MSTPLKALIQERLRAKLVRQEVDDDVGFGVLDASGFEARGELYGSSDRRAAGTFGLRVPSALADTTPLIDPSEYLLPLASPLHRAPPPPPQRRSYDKDDKDCFAHEDTRTNARKGRSRYGGDSLFDDARSMMAPTTWRYMDDALSNQLDSPRGTQPREPVSRRRRESRSPHHGYGAPERPLPATRARGSFERPCKDYSLLYDNERYSASYVASLIDYEDVGRYERRGRADDGGNALYVSSNEHLELRRDRRSRQKSEYEYSWPERVEERTAERTQDTLMRRTVAKPSNQSPETCSSGRPRDERRLAPLAIQTVEPPSGSTQSRLTRPYDDILSPESRLAAKVRTMLEAIRRRMYLFADMQLHLPRSLQAFVEKRQKRSPQDTPRTRATQRWLQSKAPLAERLPSPSAYGGDLDGTIEL